MTTTTLAGIDLGDDVVWLDRLSWPRMRQIERETIGGRVRIAQQPRTQQGQPITLYCNWLAESVVAQLNALRDSGASMTLILLGSTYTVTFRHGDGEPVESVPIFEEYADPDPSDEREVTLRLITL
jgi:hypothetical protein